MLEKLALMLGLNPDLVALVVALAPLLAAILHSRGNRFPVLAAILDALGAKSLPAAPGKPAEPEAPLPALGEGRLLELLRRAIRDELPKIVKEVNLQPPAAK